MSKHLDKANKITEHFQKGYKDGKEKKINIKLSQISKQYRLGYERGLKMAPVCLFIRRLTNPEENMYQICNVQFYMTIENIKTIMIHELQDCDVSLSKWYIRSSDKLVPIFGTIRLYQQLENNDILFFETVENASTILPIELNFPLSESEKELRVKRLVGPNIPSASAPWTIRDGRNADDIFPLNPLMPHISLRQRFQDELNETLKQSLLEQFLQHVQLQNPRLLSMLTNNMSEISDSVLSMLPNPETVREIVPLLKQLQNPRLQMISNPMLSEHDIVREILERLLHEYGLPRLSIQLGMEELAGPSTVTVYKPREDAADAGTKKRNPKTKRSCKKRHMKWVHKKGYCRKSKNIK